MRIATYLKAYRGRLVGALICSAGVAGFYASYAWLVQYLVDDIFINKDPVILALFPIAFISVAFLKGLFAYGQSYLMSYVGNRTIAEIRQELFVHLMHLPLGYHDENTSGRLVARVINDVNHMGHAIPTIFKDLLQQGLTFFALVVWTFYLNWKLASVLFIVIPLSLFVIVRLGKRLRRLSTRGQESIGDMASVLKEAFAGIRIVKAYGREPLECERVNQANMSFMRANMKSAQLSAMSSPLMEMIASTGIVVIVWYGGYLIVIGAMTAGEVSSFVVALFMAYAPIRRLAGANNAIQNAIAGAQRVFDVLSLDHEQKGDPQRESLAPISRSLEFQNVTFFYKGKSDPALVQVQLTIRCGEMVALVGSSGSGKTTLASLVPRFYSPSEGAVLIDGQDIGEATLSSLRSQMAIVSQDTVLFDDTIRNNIAYGKADASDVEIVDAAKAAHAYEFIERMPQGLNTLIGENGLKLSGGQRQRLAIARAILRDPPLLILDEATSSLDSESEQVVQEALANLLKNRTTLVIAHRLSTVQHADRIVVLSHGKIMEEGSHSDLLRRSGMYKRLYQTQFHNTAVETVTP